MTLITAASLMAVPAAASASDVGADSGLTLPAGVAEVEQAYGRALALARFFGEDSLAPAAAQMVAASSFGEGFDPAEGIAGPPSQKLIDAAAESSDGPFPAPEHSPGDTSTGPGVDRDVPDSGGPDGPTSDGPTSDGAAASESGQSQHGPGVRPDPSPSPSADGVLRAGPADAVVDVTDSRQMEGIGDVATSPSTVTADGFSRTPSQGSATVLSGRLRAGSVDGFVCPVPGATWFTHDWGFPRSGGRTHKGNDIFAPSGSPLLATADATVIKVRRTESGLGGKTVSLLDPAGRVIYYAHMDQVAPQVRVGGRVGAGEQIGTVGNTGNARYTPPHLHIGIYSGSGIALDPWPLTSATCPGAR